MDFRNKIKFVGTGGVFDYNLVNASAIVETEQGNVLIDCGYTVYPELDKNNLIESIDYVLLTHLHGDHVGSIHPLILTIVNKYKRRVKVIYPTVEYKELMTSYFKYFLIDVDRYVDFVDIKRVKGLGFIDTSNKHVVGMLSFAYYFEFEDGIIYYSGDVGDPNFAYQFTKENEKMVVVFHETSFLQGFAHVYYKELQAIPFREIYVYHCNYEKAPADCNLKFVALEELFLI